MSTQIKERPIIFNTAMVQAILNDSKSQTRRIIKPQPPVDALMKEHSSVGGYWLPYTADGRLMNSAQGSRKNDCGWYCPYGQVGDRLWVRETWKHQENLITFKADNGVKSVAFNFGRPIIDKWRPSIFMPRWASRITLEITDIRVERVQEITVEDAIAEGCMPYFEGGDTLFIGRETFHPARGLFRTLWDSLNAKRGYGWDTNCWVWVIGFKKSIKGE